MADRFEALYLGSIFNKKKTPPCCPLVAIDNSATVTYTGLGTTTDPFIFTAAGGDSPTFDEIMEAAFSAIPDGLYNIEKVAASNYQLRAIDQLLRYKESATPTTDNDYVATGQFAVVVGGQTNSALGINSIALGGAQNISNGDDSFGIGDNSAVVGGYQNQALAVDSVVLGGNNNVISVAAVGAVILCGGFNSVTGDNSSTIASGFCTVNGANSVIIAQNGEGSNHSFILTGTKNVAVIGGSGHNGNADSSIILGGLGLTSYSFGEVNVGEFNTVYTPASTTAWVTTDRVFNIGIGTSSGAKADGFTVLKSGKVGIGQSVPTATLHIKAGSATAGTAPVKLTAGPLLTTPENGVFEFDGTHLYFTIGSTRNTLI